jgi:hypothetical protein
MQKRIQKLWTVLSILLLLFVLASLIFFPSLTRFLSLAAILLGLGISIFFIVQRHRKAHQAGKITLVFMRRAIAIDIAGLLITMGMVMFAAGRAGAYAAQAATTAWGMTVGILAAIAVGLVSGVVLGLLVRLLWGKLTKPILAKAA